MTDVEDLRTPSEWEKITGVLIHDGDGWDGPEDWDRVIDHQTFMLKAANSTIEITRSGLTWDEIISGSGKPADSPLLPKNKLRGSHVGRG